MNELTYEEHMLAKEKENIIGKELLSEVLKCRVIEIEEHLDSEYDPCINIHYETINDTDYEGGVLLLNIYELAHKCKEWADKIGYTIWSNANGDTNVYYDGLNCLDVQEDSANEVTFKACEWILKETSK